MALLGSTHGLQGQGGIELVCGPMFSGKTEELIRRVRRAQIARQKVQIFKPQIDTRYDERNVVSHNSLSVEAIPVKDSADIFRLLKDSTRVIAIDEVQFFDNGIIDVVNRLAVRGYRVICAGLDLDYKGIPFGPIPMLLAMADHVMKLQSICMICGAPASRSQRISGGREQILVGESNHYEARCRAHYDEYEHEVEMEVEAEVAVEGINPISSSLSSLSQ